jgi:hypothetical protein
MKVYIATAVNGRKEPTLQEKQRAALVRVNEIKAKVKELHPSASVWSSVGNIVVARKGMPEREAAIMGSCVRMVMESDILVLDRGWWDSKGCNVEKYTAETYGVQIWEIDQFDEIKLFGI